MARTMAGEKGLVLHDFWVSPFGQRVRIALAEKGLAYQYVEYDKSDGLRSNPVPILIHDGRPVHDSLVIVQYLDEAFPDAPALLPSDPYARAEARGLAWYVDNKVYVHGSRLWKFKGEPQAQACADMLVTLKALDGKLRDKPFFGGDKFGFVDAAFAPFTAWFHSYERYGEFSVAEVAPKIAAWAKRCGERESVAKSLYSPDKVYDFICMFRKKHGIEEGLVLHDFRVNPFGQRVRIALAEKGLAYQYVEHDRSDYLRSNPVPLLLHDGRRVKESLAIVQYLEDAFPDAPALLPSDPYARAEARFLASYVDKVYDCGSRLSQLKGEPQVQSRAEMLAYLKYLDGKLRDKPFFGGDKFGFVDAAFAPFTAWCHSYERYGEFSVAEVAPKIASWAKRCGERESVAKSLSSHRVGARTDGHACASQPAGRPDAGGKL